MGAMGTMEEVQGCSGGRWDLPEGVPVEENIEAEKSGRVVIETRRGAPREFYISRKDADKYGYTRGCGGCTSWHRVWGDNLIHLSV